MGGILYKALIVLLGAGLSVALVTWSRARQELQVVTVANETLRKTLGEMAIAITDKDRQIDRLSQSQCSTPNKTEMPAKHTTSGAKLAQAQGADR